MVNQHHLFTATRVRLVLIAAVLGVTFGLIDAEFDSLIHTWGTDESYLAQLTAEFLQPELREVGA